MSEHGKAACTNLGGQCVTEQDGYYIVSALCVGFGLLSVLFFLIPTAKKLQGALLRLSPLYFADGYTKAVPVSKWRIYS